MKLRIFKPDPKKPGPARVAVDKACCETMEQGLTHYLLIPFARKGEPLMLALLSHNPKQEKGVPLRIRFCPWCAEEITVEPAVYTPPTGLVLPPGSEN